jgi:hypothetical protein
VSQHDVASLTTTHFRFSWDDAAGPDAPTNVAAVAATAEADLSRLAGLFSAAIDDDWGPVDVRVDLPAGSGGRNFGYRGGPLELESVVRTRELSGLADDEVRMIFVAELAEILMDYQDSRGGGLWQRLDSTGEGLSRVMANELHHDGFLRFTARTTEAWIIDGTDYVDSTYPSDVYAPAFACAFLFLYYLHIQLGYSWQTIIATHGVTLQDKYAELGGIGSGFEAMTALLADFFEAVDDTPDPPDNPFPLYADARHGVMLSAVDETNLDNSPASSGQVTISPGGLCPPAQYGYSIYANYTDVVFSTHLYGFGVPVYAWTVNGVPVPPAGGPITVQASVTPADPSDLSPVAVPDQTVEIFVEFDLSGPDAAQQLSVSANALSGTVGLTVGVTVSERYATDVPSASAEYRVSLETERIVYDAPFRADRQNCLAEVEKMLDEKVFRIPPYLLDFRPDPDPLFRQYADLLVSLRNISADLNKLDPKEAASLVSGLASAYGIPQEYLA